MITKFYNLNYKLCSHFSPLDKAKTVCDFEELCRNSRRVSELMDVEVIGLWGGEALLCPDLHKYIYVVRKNFPNSEILLGSNGLLVPKMTQELVDAIKETNTVVSISLYPPTLRMIDDIKQFLDSNSIRQRYPRSSKVERFGRKYVTSGDRDIRESWSLCSERQCATVFEGKIAECYFPLLSDLFNEEYGETFITDEDNIDLYAENLTTKNLLARLRKPMKSCRYCADMVFENWQTVPKDATINDWVL